MDVEEYAPSVCAVQLVDTLPIGTYLYARTRPAALLIARAWWRTLACPARYATLASLAHRGESNLALLPPMQMYGRGQQMGCSELADVLAALSPAIWQALVEWTG